MKPIIDILSNVLTNSKFFDLFKGKERLKNEFLMVLAKQLHDANYRQTEINKIEASHKNIFVSGWRPFIGWVCGSALAYQFILRDFISYAMNLLEKVGSITKGKLANLILTKKINSYNYIPYSFGNHCIEKVFLKGKEIKKS